MVQRTAAVSTEAMRVNCGISDLGSTGSAGLGTGWAFAGIDLDEATGATGIASL